jgi:hypothetical protein
MQRRRTRVVRRKDKNVVPFIRGHRINMPSHPTEFCAIPWNSLIVRINNPTTSVTLGGLYTEIVSQLTGLSFANGTLNVRLHSVRVWGPIPTTNTALRVTIRDVFDDVVGVTAATGTILEVIENYADQVNRAHCGYVFSTAQQQKSLYIINGSTDPIVTLSGMGNGSVVYIQLLWRPFPLTGLATNEVRENFSRITLE